MPEKTTHFPERSVLCAFPASITADAQVIYRCLDDGSLTVSHGQFTRYTLAGGEQVFIPYRIYGGRCLAAAPELAGFTRKMVFHALLSRHASGWIREAHIRAILAEDCPDWLFPYIVKLADEYVIEILEAIYRSLQHRDCGALQSFCQQNPAALSRGYARMVSYWNEYHRETPFFDYVGTRLFKGCFAHK